MAFDLILGVSKASILLARARCTSKLETKTGVGSPLMAPQKLSTGRGRPQNTLSQLALAYLKASLETQFSVSFFKTFKVTADYVSMVDQLGLGFDSPATSSEEESQTHFWVCSSTFVESALFMVPTSDLAGSSRLELYDCDGTLINDVECSFPPGEVGALELDQLLGSCKLESGIKHGHLKVISEGVSPFLRMFSRTGAFLVGDPIGLSGKRPAFFPVSFSERRVSYICLVNQSDREVTVKCRLFCAKRMPETYGVVPAMGARMICLNTEFKDYLPMDEDSLIPAYVRLSTAGDQTCGVQLFEQLSSASGETFFGSVS